MVNAPGQLPLPPIALRDQPQGTCNARRRSRPAPLVGNAYTQRLAAPRLPSDWPGALARFGASAFMREYFGERFVTLYELTRRGEMQDFNARLTALDYAWYLEQV